MKKTFALAMILGACWGVLAGAVEVTDVAARQRYPWNGKVDMTVTFSGASNDVATCDCAFVATNVATQTALNVSHITGIDGAIGSGTTWTRKFIWDAGGDVGAEKIEDVELVVAAKGRSLEGVQLWENGPYWAECNVGAAKPEDSGETAVNGRKVWECFVAGLCATDPEAALRAFIELRDGRVCLSWKPNLNTGEVTRIYRLFGRTDLDRGDWETPAQPGHRFFKVAVSMPTGADGEESAVAGEGFVPTANSDHQNNLSTFPFAVKVSPPHLQQLVRQGVNLTWE